jgi:DNA-directed RNA polymerase specialized sigma24 family protein
VQKYPVSLDVLVGESGEETFGDMLAVEVDQDAILLEALDQALNQLPELQRRAVVERFNGNASKVRGYRHLSKELGLSAKVTMGLVEDALAFLQRELVGEVC